MQVLRCGRFRLELDRPRIMAIVNVTPDSFSGDGLGRDLDAAVRRAQAAVDAGADLLDIGGESTRPGSEPVSEQEELDASSRWSSVWPTGPCRFRSIRSSRP